MAINVLGHGRRGRARLSVVATGALVGALLTAVSSGTASAAECATVGSQVTCTFSYNGTNGSDGTPQNFVVPAGVTSVTIEAWGAQGGGGSGAPGGHVKGTVTVTPTETLTVRVGGAPTLTTGGYNGGGNSLSSNGGGGASDVRQHGDALADRIVVAGGGGGGASGFPRGGGGRGGPSGDSGAYCMFPGCGGATPTHGGMGGVNSGCGGINGGDGRLGVGGDGGSGCGLFGGGGGGGLYGGGGGSANQVFQFGQFFTFASGGGGGSGFVSPTATDQINEGGTRSSEVTITYTPGNIFATTFKSCTTLHVGYNRFINGTIVHWTVTETGLGTVDSGQFSAIGGGALGSKTYHFIDEPLSTPLKGGSVQAHVQLTWANGGTYSATRDPGC